jgi:Acyltransferase family
VRDDRIDLLKTIATTFVVVWHLHPLYVDGVPAIAWAVRAFEFEVSLTAVPTFLLVSFALFYKKSGALGPRLWRLTSIYLFWAGVQTVLAFALARPTFAWDWLWLGGPALPITGGSVFYYLFALIVLTAIAQVYAQIPEPWRKVAGIAIVLVSLAWFEVSLVEKWPIPYYRLDAFLIYVPTAYYLSRLTRFKVVFALAYVAYAAQDLYFARLDDAPYGRGTVYFGALALYGFVMAAAPRARPAARVIATYSLGIYAIHKYWQLALMLWKGSRTWNVTIAGATVHLAALAIFIATLALTAVTIALARATPLRRMVA